MDIVIHKKPTKGMENLSPPALFLPMPSFGETLQRLRELRSLSQDDLADLAGISSEPIQRVEQTGKCNWRAKTMRKVMEALHKASPLTEQEAQQYLRGAGYTDEHFEVMKRASAPMRELAAVAARVPQLQPQQLRAIAAVAMQSNESLAATAHNWLAMMIAKFGAGTMVDVLIGLADQWGVELPPRVMPADAKERDIPDWLKLHFQFENRPTTIYYSRNDPTIAPAGPKLQPNSTKLRRTGDTR